MTITYRKNLVVEFVILDGKCIGHIEGFQDGYRYVRGTHKGSVLLTIEDVKRSLEGK